MKRMQAYRFELKPSPSQERRLARFAGCSRFVFNKGLELQRNRYAAGLPKLGYAALCKELTNWRHAKETAFLGSAPTHPLQQALKDLDRAYKNAFEGRTGFPKFKKRGRRDSFRYPDPKQFRVDEQNGRVFLPKLGWVPYRQSRRIEGEVNQITVINVCGKWFVSIQTEREMEQQPQPVSQSSVGIDLGVVNFATLSDGTVYAPVNSYRSHQNRLTKEQKKLSRKQKFSSNWRKQVKRVQRVHKRIADVRRDFLHKTSTAISKNHAIVVVEDLSVKNMSSSAAGTIENPGKNVKAKSGLNKSILDQGWGEFRRQLEYKLHWSGGTLVLVDPRNTSNKCSVCGCTDSANRISQSKFQCVSCEYLANADLNAAHNVLAAGRAVLACREKNFSVKQEPTVSAVSAA